MKITMLFLIATITLESSASAWLQAEDASKEEGRRIFDSTKKFSIIPPKGWNDFPKSMGKNTILSRISGIGDNFSNFNVQRIQVPEKVTSLKEFVHGFTQKYRETMPGFMVDEETELKINGRAAYYMFSTRDQKPGNSAIKIHAGSYVVMGEGNDVYIITFSMTPTVYARIKPLVKKSAETIRIDP
jgi:hypothetical protein